MHGYSIASGIGRGGVEKCGMTEVLVSLKIFICRLQVEKFGS